MEVVMLPQLRTTGIGGGANISPRYRLKAAEMTEGGTVELADRAITTVDQGSRKSITLRIPEKEPGCARDFVVKIKCSSTPPQVGLWTTSSAPVYESDSYDTFPLLPGVNLLSFTETEEDVFFVTRRSVHSL